MGNPTSNCSRALVGRCRAMGGLWATKDYCSQPCGRSRSGRVAFVVCGQYKIPWILYDVLCAPPHIICRCEATGSPIVPKSNGSTEIPTACNPTVCIFGVRTACIDFMYQVVRFDLLLVRTHRHVRVSPPSRRGNVPRRSYWKSSLTCTLFRQEPSANRCNRSKETTAALTFGHHSKHEGEGQHLEHGEHCQHNPQSQPKQACFGRRRKRRSDHHHERKAHNHRRGELEACRSVI